MNTSNLSIEQKPTIYLDHPVVGITSPEFQEFAKAVIQAIARATKKKFRSFGGAVIRAWRFIERKNREAVEMHNRAQMNLDDRYARNWFYIRSAM